MVANLSNDHGATIALPSPTSYDHHRGVVINHDPTSVVAVVEGVTLIVIFLGALVANVIAMTAILRDKLLRKNLHNWLILNLIVNDLGIAITSMSFSIVSVFDHGQFLINNPAMCLVRIYSFLEGKVTEIIIKTLYQQYTIFREKLPTPDYEGQQCKHSLC